MAGRTQRYTPTTVWELIWLMVIMKIPIIYLCWVVYWAIKSEPRPEEPAVVHVVADRGGDPPRLRANRRPRRPGPHGRPTRSYARTRRPVVRT
jgi:hypothetical protein